MIVTPAIMLESISAAWGEDASDLPTLAVRAAKGLSWVEPPRAVVAATFSNPNRFPALSVRVAAALGLPSQMPAFDLQMACSAYPYALYVAGRLAADLKGSVLVINGDVQTPLVDAADHATGKIFSDAATATLVTASDASQSRFDFLSHYDEALTCPSQGPIRMDGFKVFTFVATEVRAFLAAFLAEAGDAAKDALFVPHQANAYMVRQLARSLNVEDRLLTLPEARLNPGSCSIPTTLVEHPHPGKAVLLAGFGAGYSASAALVRLSDHFSQSVQVA